MEIMLKAKNAWEELYVSDRKLSANFQMPDRCFSGYKDFLQFIKKK